MSGTPVSPGLARGPLLRLDDSPAATARVPETAATEAAVLRAALDAARDDLGALARRTRDADAETILVFQTAMLEDPVVTDPAFAAIADGCISVTPLHFDMTRHDLLSEVGRWDWSSGPPPQPGKE